MIVNVNALLVFCEGPHDVAYVRIVLSKLMGFAKIVIPFSELPSPFNSLFKMTVTNHAVDDLSLDMAHKFFLPDSVLKKDEHFILLFNSGGKTQYEKIRTLLSDYLPIFPNAQTFAQGAQEVVGSVRYLFLYDADAEGLDGVLNNVKTEFSKVNGIDFLTDGWVEISSQFGKRAGDKAVFVWGESPEKGTLEDILIPMFTEQNSDLIDKASSAMDNMFSWDTSNEDLNKSVPETERRHKAILTVVGQKKKPGSSMNVILEQSGLLDATALTNNVTTQELVEFIKSFIGLSL